VAGVAALGALAAWIVTTQLFPHHSLNHDEAVYLQQAAMLLEGQLWLRPPVEGAFRPWFFVADGGRLYPKYAPVPAAVFAVGELLGEARIALALVAAGNLALVAAVTTEVFDRRTGLLAAGFVLASPLFLLNSAVFLPYAPTTLLNLAFAYAYLRADRTGERRLAAGAGAAVGLAFFSRPYTAVLFAAPFVCHALVSLRREGRPALARQSVTAALGLAGVAVALAYNATVTGSPLTFPYEAFAPRDGLGFGLRRILDHEVVYTPELAVRANARVVRLLFTEWVAGGALGSLLAAAGLASALRRRTPRAAVLAGLAGTVVVGNVYFWGNYNVLGALEVPGDGLVAALGPYYHFDLLLPTAAFAAVGALRAAGVASTLARRHLEDRHARVAVALLVVGSVGAAGAVTAENLEGPVEENAAATATYERAYAPFAGGPPANAVVLVPDPYGDWLNHPFQPLRNDPGFDGRAVYALDDRPFAVASAFPDRTLYRYVYRGAWAPTEGSPEAARLQRVESVSGREVRFRTTVGVPAGAESVTARVATDEGSAYSVVTNPDEAVTLHATVTDGRARLGGDVRSVDDRTAPVAGRETVRLTVFVDYGAGGGFTYRFDLPVDAEGDRVRVLSPRVERCLDPRTCGGAAAHVPETAPDGVFVRTELVARDPNP
jgi:4-amino-4-deoxy-L-arabinose transferase-like glycosyltransferase